MPHHFNGLSIPYNANQLILDYLRKTVLTDRKRIALYLVSDPGGPSTKELARSWNYYLNSSLLYHLISFAKEASKYPLLVSVPGVVDDLLNYVKQYSLSDLNTSTHLRPFIYFRVRLFFNRNPKILTLIPRFDRPSLYQKRFLEGIDRFREDVHELTSSESYLRSFDALVAEMDRSPYEKICNVAIRIRSGKPFYGYLQFHKYVQ